MLLSRGLLLQCMMSRALYTEKGIFITDEDTGGVSNGVPTVATDNSTTSHITVQASDARGVSTCGGVGLIYALL